MRQGSPAALAAAAAADEEAIVQQLRAALQMRLSQQPSNAEAAAALQVCKPHQQTRAYCNLAIALSMSGCALHESKQLHQQLAQQACFRVDFWMRGSIADHVIMVVVKTPVHDVQSLSYILCDARTMTRLIFLCIRASLECCCSHLLWQAVLIYQGAAALLGGTAPAGLLPPAPATYLATRTRQLARELLDMSTTAAAVPPPVQLVGIEYR